jgi:hypothetical protein
MTDVATSANLNDVQETNMLISSINKGESEEEKFDLLYDEMVYRKDDGFENKLLNNSQMKRHWVRFF